MIQARIDKTQQNSMYVICYRDQTIYHILIEGSKLLQEYKTRHVWVGKVIQWELCKKFKFDHTNKWYIHSRAAVLENKHTHTHSYGTMTYRLINSSRPEDQTL